MQFCILYWIKLACCLEKSVDPDQLASEEDKKPADLNLHCFRLSLYMVSYCFHNKKVDIWYRDSKG